MAVGGNASNSVWKSHAETGVQIRSVRLEGPTRSYSELAQAVNALQMASVVRVAGVEVYKPSEVRQEVTGRQSVSCVDWHGRWAYWPAAQTVQAAHTVSLLGLHARS